MYGDDLAFLRAHVEVVELVSADGRARVAVVPAWQGRVATSTPAGPQGPSCGWIHRDQIARGIRPPEERRGRLEEHIHVFGGEERFWLGPEGGQFSVYFAPGVPFDFDHWQVPAPIDTDPFRVVRQTATEVEFVHEFRLTNWSGHVRAARVQRTVRLVEPDAVVEQFPRDARAKLEAVAYETDNRLTNVGDQRWTPETGLLSIWILGMYPPSPATVVVIPIRPGDESELGPRVRDTYFGAVPPTHLRVTDRHVLFRGDGTRRGKIGISPRRSLGCAASWAPEQGILTLVTCTRPRGPARYVNSMWEMQADPYDGDELNAYNDGPPAPGLPPLGPFYELETSSPGGELAPGDTLRHVSRTLHLRGEREALDLVARRVLDIGLNEIEAAFR